MEAMNQDGDMANGESKHDEEHTPDMVDDQLKSIAESGNVDIDWPDLQRLLKQRFRTVMEHYIERNRDSKEEQYQEPNVEKFNLEDSRDDIIELIESFSEAPFTIQRICELLCTPFKYYDKISTFLRGLEKNLRVISSNDWPKPQVSEPTQGLITNTSVTITQNHVQVETVPMATTTTTTTAVGEMTTDSKSSPTEQSEQEQHQIQDESLDTAQA